MSDVSTRLQVATGFGAAVALIAVSSALVPAPRPAAAQGAVSHPVPAPAVSYADQIQPMFDNRCVRCHGGVDEGERRLEAGLDLMSYEGLLAGSEFGTVIEAGDTEGSILLEMVEAGDMPEEGDPATAEEIELLRTWIAEGAENN